MRCPAVWYERYVNRRQKSYGEGQRDDPLAIGSLVHEGLRQWQLTQQVGIPDVAIAEVRPTRDALDMCLALVQGYTQAYPSEGWDLVRCEEPLRFPLLKEEQAYQDCGMCLTDYVGVDGLAKIDAYFYVPQLTQLPSGDGNSITLDVGWWIHEYKTKDPGIDLALWMRKWEMNMQASFQLLALQNQVDTTYPNGFEYPKRSSVMGVLVNILEKPKLYQPKRKCKKCEQSYEFVSWIATAESNVFSCPICGNIQKIAKLKEDPVTSPPRYYRQIVTRDNTRLERDKNAIAKVATEMNQYRLSGSIESYPWNTESCINTMNKRVCEYMDNHVNRNSTVDDARFIQIEDYINK